ncbi:MAG: hypothetical protein ACTHLN_05065 [Tepidisphaeraceae bacterium]
MRQVTDLRQLTGLWRRRELRWSDGRLDATTQVWWLQASTHYADLRLPTGAGTPEGFAGELLPEAGAWHWRRHLDLSPPGEFRDIGRLAFFDDDDDRMLEEGVEQPYTEIWERTARATELPSVWVRREAERVRGYMVVAAGYAMLARPGEISLASCEGAAAGWRVSESNIASRRGQLLLDQPLDRAWERIE